jgi:monovalent cation/hydrogen antiporter
VHGVETVLFLVVLGTVVAAFAGRLRVPAPSLLVIAGLVVALLPRFPAVHVPPEVVSLVVLPPLLYAASEELPWRDLRAVWRPVAVLAVGLVLASAAAVAAVTWAVAAVPASMAFVLGVGWASTDPVAVSALGRRLALPAKVQALVQAESLFNDATSLVLFQIAVSFAVAGTAGPAGGVVLHAAGQFAVLAAGGAAVGGVIAAGVIPVRRRVTDPVLETVLALITPYAAFVAGEALHVSPVMAVIVAGLVIGGRRERITTAQTRLQLHSVYGTVIFLLESVVFSLIGLQLPTLIRDLSRAQAWPAEALAVAGTLIVTRIVWVFPLSAVSQRRGGARRPAWPVPAVVSWAGARGVVPLAAALSIPLTAADGAPLPRRDLILVLATAVIVVSLIVQGLTLEPLVRRAGIARTADARHEQTMARLRLAEAALARLDELAAGDCAADDVIDRARASLQARIGRTRTRIDGTEAAEPDGLTDRELRRDLNAAEHAELARLYDDGTHQPGRPPAASAQPGPGGHPAQRATPTSPCRASAPPSTRWFLRQLACRDRGGPAPGSRTGARTPMPGGHARARRPGRAAGWRQRDTGHGPGSSGPPWKRPAAPARPGGQRPQPAHRQGGWPG